MGKKSSAAAQEKRTAQRLAERQMKELLARRAAGYTEARLAGIRANIKAAIPQLGASMAVKAVDVFCLKTLPAFADEHDASNRLLIELAEELEVHLEDIEVEGTRYHPMEVITALVTHEEHAHNSEMIAAAEAGLEGQRAQGKGPLVQQPASIIVLQAAAAATGNKQRVKTQVGPSGSKGSKAGPRAPGLKAQGKGPMVQGSSVQQQHKGTLGIDLGGRARLSKPRSLKIVDELMWGGAQQHALQEITAVYSVPTDIELYYY